MKQMTIFT